MFDIQNYSGLKWPYPVNYGKENRVTVDVLVVGGGIAGCHAAINAARKGLKVAVVDKGPIVRSGDGGAGVDHWHMALTNPCSKVTPEEMMDYIKEYGDWCYSEFGLGLGAYIQCKESYDTLLDIEQMGLKVRDLDDEFKGAPFRDEETRLLFSYDYTNNYCIRVVDGANIKVVLYKELQRLGVELCNNTMVTSLLTENGQQGKRVIGATGVSIRTGEFYIYNAKATILSAGIPSGLWNFSTEHVGASSRFTDPNNTGDGCVIAWKAGAEFTMMEGSGGPAPGCFAYPNYGTGNAHNSWFACNIVDADGKVVPWVNRDGQELKTISDRNSAAPGQKLFLHYVNDPYKVRGPVLIPELPEKIQKGEYKLPLYADLTSMPECERRAIWGLMVGNEGKSRIIYNNYSRAGFDPAKDMLQAVILPPAGYVYRPWGAQVAPQIREINRGGLVFDWDLKTSLDGLYVAGAQKAGNGNHSHAATTGRYAGRKAAEYAQKVDRIPIDYPQIEAEKQRIYAPITRDKGIGWKELKAGLCRIMQEYCGEYKHENTLKRGLEWFDSINESEAATVYARNPHELVRSLECLNHITLGELVIQSCLARKASCAALCFNRLDYPEMDPPEWDKFITIKLEKNLLKTGELPLRYWLQAPYSSSYEENYRKHCSM